MKMTRREFVDTLLVNPFAAPLTFIAKGKSPAVDKPAQWAAYSVNAVATGGARLAVPFNAARFAVQDAKRRGRKPLSCARAAALGFVAGTAVSTVGIVWNVGQVIVSAGMLGVSSGLAAFEHGLDSIEAAATPDTAPRGGRS